MWCQPSKSQRYFNDEYKNTQVSNFCDGKGIMNAEQNLDFTSHNSLNNFKLLDYRTVEKFRQIVLF
jgi:hypothetical protein